MRTRMVERNKTKLLDMQMIRSFLRIPEGHDDVLLAHFLQTATQWVEEQLGKTFLNATREVVHDNNRFRLPYGPVQKILEVTYHNKPLKENEYECTPKGDSMEITLPFRWKSPKVQILYLAGYGESPEDVPHALKQAVLGTIDYLYENKGASLSDHKASWLTAQRTYAGY